MTEIQDIKKLIEGKRVVSVSQDDETLTLDDGTILHLYESYSDCCASAYGNWVTHPDALQAIITDVKIEVTKDRVDNGDGSYSEAVVTILHNQNPIAQAECYANDGNGGYYYSILSMRVSVPKRGLSREDTIIEVVSA